MVGFFRRKKDKEVEAIFEKMSLMLGDDDMQIRMLGPKTYSDFKSLTAIDQHRDADGELGISLNNPIPTNGPIGSVSYLSNLVTKSKHKILFHRIKVIKKIDVYEYVSICSSLWGFLFLDMYHSRKSKLTPNGFERASEPQQFIGFNHFWDDFPYGYAEQKSSLPFDFGLLYVPIGLVSNEMIGREYNRPERHKAVFDKITSIR